MSDPSMAILSSPAAGPLPFTTTVSALPLPVALERLFVARATGILTLEARPGRHVVYLREGYPVAVELPGSFELLGKVLFEMKLLDDATYQASIATPPPEGTRYGELLLSKGLVTEDQLRHALKAQVRRKLHRLFFLTDAQINYTAGEHREGLQHNESLRVHPWRATYHGVRSAWNADRLRAAIAPLAGKSLRTPLSADELARFGLGAEDGKTANLLRTTPHTVEALATASGLPIQPVSALCYALYVASALEDTGTAAGTAAGTVAPTPVLTPAAIEFQGVVAERLTKIDGEDLFQVLGVTRTASSDAIKTAYLDSARRFHPDRLASLGLERLRGDVERIFRRVSEAQSKLLDEQQRAQYLASLDKPASADTAAHKQALAILEAELALKRGQHLLKKNDLGGALREFEAALAAQPDEAEHVIYVAWARHCLGQLMIPEAKAEMMRGLKLRACANGHYLLGMLLKEEDAVDPALAAFKKAVTMDPRHFDAEQEIRLLETRRSRQSEKRGLFDRFRKR